LGVVLEAARSLEGLLVVEKVRRSEPWLVRVLEQSEPRSLASEISLCRPSRL
jgi:hypothetical protein